MSALALAFARVHIIACAAALQKKVRRLTHDKVPLSHLSIPDLLVQRVIRQVDLGKQALIV